MDRMQRWAVWSCLLLFGMGAVMLIRRRASAHLGIVD
jgi:hypothetical protein